MSARDFRPGAEDAGRADVRPARELEKIVGHTFRDPSLLEEALTHSSYRNECRDRRTGCNERLEFLGDSVLSVVTAEYLFKTYPREAEGFLTRMRAALVCENTLAVLATEIGLGDFMYFGHGERTDGGGKQRKSTLADAFEALLAAIYLDSGSDLEAARAFLLPRLKRMIPEVSRQGEDYKSILQRIVQQTPEEELRYEDLPLCRLSEFQPARRRLRAHQAGSGTGSRPPRPHPAGRTGRGLDYPRPERGQHSHRTPRKTNICD